MADKNNIDIAIKTTGDTAGAEKVDAAIKKVDETRKGSNEASEKEAKSIFSKNISKEKALEMDLDLGKAQEKYLERLKETALAQSGLTGKIAASVGEAKALAGPVMAVYKVMTTTFGAVKGQFDSLAAAYPDLEKKNIGLSTVIKGLADPMKMVKDTFSGMGDSIINFYDKIYLNGSIASIKAAVDAKAMADKMAAAYEKAADAHAKMADRMRKDAVAALLEHQANQATLLADKLSGDQQIADARGNLAAQRQADSGASAGTQAVSTMQREMAADKTAIELAKVAVAEANRKAAEVFLVGSEAQKDAAQTMVSLAENKLNVVLETSKADLTAKLEKAGATNQADADEAAAQVTAQGVAALAALRAAAQEQGEKFPNDSKLAIATLANVIEKDKIPDTQQVSRIIAAIEQGRISQINKDDQVAAALQKSTDSIIASKRNFDTVLGIIQANAAELAAIRYQLETLLTNAQRNAGW